MLRSESVNITGISSPEFHSVPLSCSSRDMVACPNPTRRVTGFLLYSTDAEVPLWAVLVVTKTESLSKSVFVKIPLLGPLSVNVMG